MGRSPDVVNGRSGGDTRRGKSWLGLSAAPGVEVYGLESLDQSLRRRSTSARWWIGIDRSRLRHWGNSHASCIRCGEGSAHCVPSRAIL